MNQDEFKKLLEEALDPIKKTLSQHTDILGKHTDILENQLLPSVATMENEIKIYGDMYKLNNDNMKKLEKRLETLEDHSGIQPPPELTLAKIQT